MTTAERLQSYYPFDQEVVDRVAEVAEEQHATDYKTFLDRHLTGGVENESQLRKTNILDHLPDDCDPKSALMIYLAMGQPLDPNNLYQIATIAAVNPNHRIVVAANPSSPTYHAPHYSREQRKAIAEGNLAPVAEPMLRHAEANDSHKIEIAPQYGYSFGADVAMEAASSQAFEVPHAIAIEPAAVVERSVGQLGSAFRESGKALKGYVEQSGPGFRAARDESIKLGFFAGLARLSNLAISHGLSHEGFEGRARRALEAHPEMQATIAWGTASELADNTALREQTLRLAEEFGRVEAMILPEQKHALANDVHLQAAIVTQALAS